MRILLLSLLFLTACSVSRKATSPHLPVWMKGHFTDDYNIRYTISDSLFVMEGAARYHVLQWNEQGQFLLTQNDTANKTDKGLYTRIDYTPFTGMAPYNWGYCFTVYNAVDTAAALRAATADRANPKKGCNGYPFSRMRRVDSSASTTGAGYR